MRGLPIIRLDSAADLAFPWDKPHFCTGNPSETNDRVVLGENEDVFGKSVKANHVNYMAIPCWNSWTNRNSCTAKDPLFPQRASRAIKNGPGTDEINVPLKTAVRAVTPGQAVVFMMDGCVGGGGTISNEILIR